MIQSQQRRLRPCISVNPVQIEKDTHRDRDIPFNPPRRHPGLGAFTAGLAVSWGVYALLEATRPQDGTIGFAFLLVLPVAVNALVAYACDPWKSRTHGQYLRVPLWLTLSIAVLAIPILREGVICVIMLAPIWLVMGLLGAEIAYRARRRVRDARVHSIGLMLLPLLAIQAEPYIPLPVTTASISRSVLIDATPAQLWPMMKGIPDVHPGEGRWNVTQNLIGIPRPIGAKLVGTGAGADRHAVWQHNIRFRERIVDWVPGGRIGWLFVFDDVDAWGYTDRHLLPNSAHFRVVSGGYRAAAVAEGLTRLTLTTVYKVRTPVNAYATMWGELLLGDVEDNLLALIKARAEAVKSARPEDKADRQSVLL